MTARGSFTTVYFSSSSNFLGSSLVSSSDGQAARSKQDYKNLLCLPKKIEKWWIRSNGSTSIPEILKEFPRLLEKLGMMLKGRVLSKSCPLCFPNQYTRTEERSSDPQPESWKSFI
ncbi:hypothetical protein G5714_022404 [Onychostoma macrolepis]|uniref:Uncharacterized protein n=1 Tax=Onychostoma macrolepis TaxID=369639 RepID=A0A7J6BQ80_9TELE|nr:hypothetical protein G5714_022404 [Onychostoma macrolepis]